MNFSFLPQLIDIDVSRVILGNKFISEDPKVILKFSVLDWFDILVDDMRFGIDKKLVLAKRKALKSLGLVPIIIIFVTVFLKTFGV